jgi:prepilin-type N-terminal cleavage/methylation domain-containing protein
MPEVFMRRTLGFTLIELMIVVATIAIIAAIAIPNFLSSKLSANETQAIGTLRSVTSAQTQFHIASGIDFDYDAINQFGFLREMSGGVGLRASADWSSVGAPLVPSVLSGAFRAVNANGECQRSGYTYQLFLPDAAGLGIAEPSTTSLPSPPDEDQCEITWCCYAYPSSYGRSGARTFFVNQAGLITTAEDSAYAATGSFPTGTAGRAFVGSSGAMGVMTGVQAVGTISRDGKLWRSIQ